MSALQYIQYAVGGINNLSPSAAVGPAYKAARFYRITQEYFFGTIGGFKQLVKTPGIMKEKYDNKYTSFIPYAQLLPFGDKIAEFFIHPTLAAKAAGAKSIISGLEALTKLKGVFENPPAYSVWGTERSLLEKNWHKMGKIADWTMGVCEASLFAIEIGSTVIKRTWISWTYCIAGIIFCIQQLSEEGVKLYRDRIVDPLNGTESQMNWAHRINCLIRIALSTSYLAFSTFSISNMKGYSNFTKETLWFCTTSGTACTVGSHFWEKLFI